MQMKTTIDITAYDEDGNKFTKSVVVDRGDGGPILDFGWPVRYYILDLMHNYPFDHDICIDGGGLNHRRSPVWVKKDDANMLIKKFLDREFVHADD